MADVLVVEVAETSYRYDRDVELRLHARAGVPEVWIVDLAHAAVEVFREPHATGYASEQRITSDGAIAPRALPAATIAVSEILPSP
jgi:Uma2 family endonuclease